MKTQIAVAGGLAALAAPFVLPPFYTVLLNYIGLYTLVVIGLVLLTGITGLTSFGQSSFVGIAAFATAHITLAEGAFPVVGLVVGLLIVAAAAVTIGVSTLKLSGHYLALSTLAWCIALYYYLGSVQALGGNTGLTGIPPLSIGPWVLDNARSYFYLVWAVVALAWLGSAFLLNSRPGRALRLIRSSEVAAASMGVQTFGAKLGVFVVAALLAALSGWLYAHMLRFVNPTPFSLQVGIEYLFMAVIGGVGYLAGGLVGAALYTLANHLLQNWLPVLVGEGVQLELVVFGALMIVLLQRAPEGVVGRWMRGRSTARGKLELPSVKLDLPSREATVRRGELLLSVRGLVKSFGGLKAVNNVSFDVTAGSIVALIGPNGAGKSTTFNMLTGLLTPDVGAAHLNRLDVSHSTPQKAMKAGVARTFQHPMFEPGMSVLENVAVGAHGRGRAGFLRSIFRANRKEEAAIVGEAMTQLKRVGLESYAQGPAGVLPLGYQRVMEIARALCADPVLLLLDEPAAGLRSGEKENLALVLNQLRSEGLTILLVEHDMQFVLGLADKVVVMDFGSKIAEGPPDAVRRDPVVIEAYLGAPA